MEFLTKGLIKTNFRKEIASKDQITKEASPFQFLTTHD